MSAPVFDVCELYGNKIKPTNERFGLWLLQENMFDNNLVTDIGSIDYTAGEERLNSDGGKLVTISDPFCDNIMLVKVCGLQEDCEKPDQRQFLVKKDTLGAFNTHIRRTFGDLVTANYGVKAKSPYLLRKENNEVQKKFLQIIGDEDWKVIEEKYKDPVGVPFKVELAEGSFESVMERLPLLLEQLKRDHYYLMDLDITQDIAGIFNKKSMCHYLVNKHDFHYEAEENKTGNVILDNDSTAGLDCLTWTNTNTRVKVYNKFICQMTSPGVDKRIGNHVINFVECPDKRLRDTFASDKGKSHGIMRIEATIYNYKLNEDSSEPALDPTQSGMSLLSSVKEYFRGAPMYSVSIAKMWTKLTDTLKNSCCVVFNDLLQYVYWGNGLTKKLTGIQIELNNDPAPRKAAIDYVVSALSFNCLPVNLIEVVEVEDEEDKNKIRFDQKCFIKEGETFFTKTSKLHHRISEEVDLGALGLVNTKNVLPQVQRKNNNGSVISPCCKEIKVLPDISVKSVEKRRLELEELSLKRRKTEFEAETEPIPKRFKNCDVYLQEAERLKKELEPHFGREWATLNVRSEYKISAYSVMKKKYECVGILAEKTGTAVNWGKRVYYVKGKEKFSFINLYKERKNKSFMVIEYDDEFDIVCLPTLKPFCTVTTGGTETFKGFNFTGIEKVTFLPQHQLNLEGFTQREVLEFNGILMSKIDGKVKMGDCRNLETLKEGTVMVIRALKRIFTKASTSAVVQESASASRERPGPSSGRINTKRGTPPKRLRYILRLEGEKELFVSNYWLERELNEGKVNLKFKVKIKTDILKRTPAGTRKERVVFCV